LLKHTPLHAAHLEAGARMTGFAGWDMPLHYGSQIDEHHAVRRDCGMFDVSHMLAVEVAGSGARDFLRGLLANDVAKLTGPGSALYSCLLREDGGVLDDLIVYLLEGGCYRIVVNAGTAKRDLAWFEARRGAGVEIAPRRDLAILAVQGPRARERTWQAMPGIRAATEPLASFRATQADEVFVARTGYTGEDGFEIMLPAAHALALWRALREAGVTPAGLGARDTLRLEAGMNLYGQDMDESVSPLEAGLAWTVDLKSDRAFVGRAALEAARPARRLLGLVLLDKGVMRGHQQVRCASGGGEITSGGYSPTMNRSIALARLPAAVEPGDDVEVDVRGRWLKARAVKPPFVRNGRILIRSELLQ
jgi:aminomethyltransferase